MRRFFHFVLPVSAALILAAAGASRLQAEDVLTVADRLVHQHLSYVYGSEDLSKGGLDCSGFVQIAFRQAYGVELPDEADKQFEYLRQHGQVWDSTSGWAKTTLQPGDLIFYAGPDQLPRTSLISHVMMYCGHGMMVGSQGKGKRLDGSYGGVGYYHFWPHAPVGIFGESGERFLGHRRLFAYGRLNVAQAPGVHEQIVSIPTPVTPNITAPVGVTAATSAPHAANLNLKPNGLSPHLN